MGLLDFTPYDTSGGVLPIANNRVSSAFSQFPGWDQPPMSMWDLARLQAQPQQPQQTQPASLPMQQPQQQEQPQAQPPMQQPMAQPQSPGFGDRLNAGLMGFANGGGPIGAVANLIGGIATGQRQDPYGHGMEQHQQGQKALYQSLRHSGASEEDATAAALNPDAFFKTKPQWGVIGEDLGGNKQYGWINPFSQTIKQPGATAGIGVPRDAEGTPLQGEDLLAHLKKNDPMAASMVQAIIRGDASVTPRNLQKYMPAATLVDPTLQQFNYDVRKKTAMDFASGGKSANNVKSLETVGGHIDKMMEAFDKLGNTWSPDFNSIKNWFAVRGGHGAVNAYETFANGVANELGTVFRSFGMSDAEVKSWRDRITSANSPEQFQDGMGALLDMLKTRKEALAEQYRNGLRKDIPPEMFQKLDGAIAKIEGKLGGRFGAAPGPQAPSATAPVIQWERGPDGKPRQVRQQ